jgi:hypothetical protein
MPLGSENQQPCADPHKDIAMFGLLQGFNVPRFLFGHGLGSKLDSQTAAAQPLRKTSDIAGSASCAVFASFPRVYAVRKNCRAIYILRTARPALPLVLHGVGAKQVILRRGESMRLHPKMARGLQLIAD